MFISPTEPPKLHALGVVSSVPEEYGADILWSSKLGLVGIQRKEFPGDFLASVYDGRFYKLMMKMKALDLPIIIVEGKGRWTVDGTLITTYGEKRWTKSQHRNLLTSVQVRGVTVHQTDSLTDTIDCVLGLRVWSNKPDHSSLDIRPAIEQTFGTISHRDMQLHLLKSLEGVSIKRAEAIIDTLGFPFGLRVSEEDLIGVPGIGPGIARKIMETFEVSKEDLHKGA